MFQFISFGGLCSFLHLGTVQERYHKEKRSFFYSSTDSFKTRNMDKLSVDYFIQIYAADAIRMTRFGTIRYRCLTRISTSKFVQIKVFILDILAENRF